MWEAPGEVSGRCRGVLSRPCDHAAMLLFKMRSHEVIDLLHHLVPAQALPAKANARALVPASRRALLIPTVTMGSIDMEAASSNLWLGKKIQI